MLYKSTAPSFNQRWTMYQFGNILLYRSTKHIDLKSTFIHQMLYSSTNFFVVVVDASDQRDNTSTVQSSMGYRSTALYVQGDPDLESFSIAIFLLSRKYTFRPRSKPSDMPIRIYNYMYTPPPSLPSTILSSKQGEK